MNKIEFGDCRETMRRWKDQGIKAQTCITSPPYYGLRDYGHEGQIGLEETPEEYIAAMVEVFRCVWDVLEDDGTLFLNLGDSYFGSGKGPTGHNGIGDQVKRKGFSSAASVKRAKTCDTSDKELVSSPKSDCLCGNLCDVCRKAYRIGKFHKDGLPFPKQEPLLSDSIHEHKESQSDHLPTLDSLKEGDHTSTAIPDSVHLKDHECEPVPSSQESKHHESFEQHQQCSLQSDGSSSCLLCGDSLPNSSQEFSCKKGCICDNAKHGSDDRSLNKDVSDVAYPHFTNQSLKKKDLIGIPWMLAFALRADGWYLRQDIIWHKPNPMPESVQDRCTKAHEYIFLMSKSQKYYYDHKSIKDPVKQDWGTRDRSDGKYHNEGSGLQPHSGLEKSYEMANKRSVWTVNTKPYAGAHFAVFPSDLIEPCILAGAPVGGIEIGRAHV